MVGMDEEFRENEGEIMAKLCLADIFYKLFANY